MMSVTRKIINNGRYLTRLFSTSGAVLRPGYLPDNYQINDVWNKRLDSPLLQKIELDEFFFQMDRKYQTDKVISAIDVDLFAHKVTSDEFLEELEELVHRLRKSPNAAEVLPSTSHAVIRALLAMDRIDVAMRILDDRMNYGVFLDTFTANILMNKCLAEENYRDAAKVASLNMLEEDFGGSTTKLLSVLSCLKYVKNPTPTPWSEDPPPDPRETAKEETKIKCNFLRQPGFDDHFDLTNPEHIVGKTLAFASFELKEVDDVIRRSIEVLGWALYDKWERVENILKLAADKKTPLSAETLQKVGSLAQARMELIEASPDKSLPKPKLKRVPGMNLDKEGVEKIMEQLAIPDYTKVIPAVQSVLSSNQIPTADVSLISHTEEALMKVLPEQAQMEAGQQAKLYEEWEQLRFKKLEEQIRQFRNEQKLQEIQDKKRELEEKEDVIFFFDNEEDWMMRQPKPPKPVDIDYMRRVYGIRWKKPRAKKEDDNYVPPMI